MKTLIYALIAFNFPVALHAQPDASMLGTEIGGILPGTSSSLDASWSLCVGLDNRVVWKIESTETFGSVNQLSKNEICLEFDDKVSCSKYNIEGASVTMTNETGSRIGTITRTNVATCKPVLM